MVYRISIATAVVNRNCTNSVICTIDWITTGDEDHAREEELWGGYGH